jgi:hypothetical protein
MAVAKIWEPKMKDAASPFLASLPSIVPQEARHSNRAETKRRVKELCKCTGSCHEKPKALWIRGASTILKTLLRAAIDGHLASLPRPIISPPHSGSISTAFNEDVAPLIPDVAVHYRCGDNFVGYYGFLTFHALAKLIPKDARFVYILAEARGRKTATRPHLAAICDAIFTSMRQYLQLHFPTSIIQIKRGEDLYTDFARLTYAKVTICSVSTFCLWPAIASNGTAYFPQSKLIAGGDVSINLGFRWITKPDMIFGTSLEFSSPNDVVKRLRREN